MPLYEFDCIDCGHGFETLVRGGESRVARTCSSNHLENASVSRQRGDQEAGLSHERRLRGPVAAALRRDKLRSVAREDRTAVARRIVRIS